MQKLGAAQAGSP